MFPTALSSAVSWDTVGCYGVGWVPEVVFGVCSAGGESTQEEEKES